MTYDRAMASTPDIEFFYDPLCPWAWITSRFAVEVASQRDLSIRWRPISLYFVNEQAFLDDEKALAEGGEAKMASYYRPMSEYSRGLLRVATVIDSKFGNEGVERFYTECGNLIHTSGHGVPMEGNDDAVDVLALALEACGFDAALAAEADDETHDAVLRSEAETALSRTGPDVGTPIITFDLERPDEASLFGPVISRIPRGEEALRLWDAVETIARTPGIAEFKRSLRSEPTFT